jgi:DNA-binding NarL/FixJ family response regulator
VVADSDPLVRLGLRAVLERRSELVVVGEAGAEAELLQAVQEEEPHLLLLDPAAPAMGGLETLRLLHRKLPGVKIVIFSAMNEREWVRAAVRCQVSGYLVKGGSAEQVLDAVQEVAAGRRYFCPRLAEQFVDAYLQPPETTGDYERLTRREREVFLLTARGLTGAESAARLGISRRTVESHRANLMRKLGIRSQAELIRCALRRGLVALEEE